MSPVVPRSRTSGPTALRPTSDGTGRLSALVAVGAAAGLFCYEAVKTALVPHLTLWESHAITVAFGSVVAGIAARQALRRQAALHGEVLWHMRAESDAMARAVAIQQSESHYRQLVERSPDAIIVHRAGVVLYANRAHLRLIGAATRIAVVGRPLITWLDPAERPRFAASLAAFEGAADRAETATSPETMGDVPLASPASDLTSVSYRFRAVDGTWREVDVTSVRTMHEGLPATLSVLHDMTARRHAERERARSHALLEATLEATADAILVIDATGRLVGYNQQLLAMWGLPAALAASGDTAAVMRHVAAQLADPHAFVAKIAALESTQDAAFDDVLEFADGRIVERHSQPQRLADAIVGRVFSFRDVTARRALEQKLVHQAFHDALTGLANRALFQDRVAHALARTARDPDARARMAVLFIDLDHFKTVNDSLGHGAGDALLVGVTRRLLAATRGSDTVARLGGDEFAVLLEDLAAPEDARVTAERVLRALGGPIAIDVGAGPATDTTGAAAADPVRHHDRCERRRRLGRQCRHPRHAHPQRRPRALRRQERRPRPRGRVHPGDARGGT